MTRARRRTSEYEGDEDKEMKDGEGEDRRGPVPDTLVFAKCRGIPESRDLDFR